MTDQAQAEKWRRTLRAEWRTCNDKDYARRLYEACGGLKIKLFLFKPPRPLAHDVEQALYVACRESRAAKFVWQKRLEKLEQAKQKSTPINTLITNLQDHHWFERFLARHVLLYRGGEAVGHLRILAQSENNSLSDTARWLLKSIGAETTIRLAPVAGKQICPNCLVRCHIHWIDRAGQPDLSFYGCRYCRRSCNLMHCPGGIVAQLDSGWNNMYQQEDGTLFVNWSKYRKLFDFDEVEIIRAADEDVERFAVQVGNDTDPTRTPHYEQMSCFIEPDCRLSENAVRILKSTFGQIEQVSV